jgi:hypothetical protein
MRSSARRSRLTKSALRSPYATHKPGFRMSVTHKNPVSWELMQAEARINDALRYAYQDRKEPLGDPSLKDLVDDSLHRAAPKRFVLRAFLRVLFGFRKAGVSKAHMLAVHDAIGNEIELMYADEEKVSDFDTAHIEEELAEGEADVAEAEFRRNPSYPAFQTLTHKHRIREIRAKLQIKAAAQLVGVTP